MQDDRISNANYADVRLLPQSLLSPFINAILPPKNPIDDRRKLQPNASELLVLDATNRMGAMVRDLSERQIRAGIQASNGDSEILKLLNNPKDDNFYPESCSKSDRLKAREAWFGGLHSMLIALFSNQTFLNEMAGISNPTKWSFAVLLGREARRLNTGLTDSFIRDHLRRVKEERADVRDRIVAGPDVSCIMAFNNEGMENGRPSFNRPGIKEGLLKAGVREASIGEPFCGPEHKAKIVQALENSHGVTSFFFNGHGGPQHIWLDRGIVGEHESQDMHTGRAISYVELADALMRREQQGYPISEVRLVIDSCFSANFCEAVCVELKRRGAKTFPITIASTAFDATRLASRFAPESFSIPIMKHLEHRKPLTVGAYFDFEDIRDGDPTIAVPRRDGQPKDPPMIEVGASASAYSKLT